MHVELPVTAAEAQIHQHFEHCETHFHEVQQHWHGEGSVEGWKQMDRKEKKKL